MYLAAMQVYVHYSELVNFFRALSSLLCLPPDAGPAAAMAAISSLLQQTNRCGFMHGKRCHQHFTVITPSHQHFTLIAAPHVPAAMERGTTPASVLLLSDSDGLEADMVIILSSNFILPDLILSYLMSAC
jgi:hypothetical protein